VHSVLHAMITCHKVDNAETKCWLRLKSAENGHPESRLIEWGRPPDRRLHLLARSLTEPYESSPIAELIKKVLYCAQANCFISFLLIFPVARERINQDFCGSGRTYDFAQTFFTS
jgi:hypothetical protein